MRHNAGMVEFLSGDIGSKEIDIGRATVVFINNYCFPIELEQRVLAQFKTTLRDGARVISLRNFRPRFRPLSTRAKSDPCNIFRHPWSRFATPSDAVSWTSSSVEYYVYRVDRNYYPELARLAAERM
jgi:hypothetical protein